MRKSMTGLIPAAGFATRLGDIGCSKEILQIPDTGERDRFICEYLIEQYANAGIRDIVLIARHGKDDIRRALGDGGRWGVKLRYRWIEPTAGTPFSLAAAYSQFRDEPVALGFPDILIEPETALAQMCAQWLQQADIALGLVPAINPHKADMVRHHDDWLVELQIKPPHTELTQTWVLALWRPVFSELLVRETERLSRSTPRTDGEPMANSAPELYVGDFIMMALAEGFKIQCITIDHGFARDIGTPEDLAAVGAHRWRG